MFIRRNKKALLYLVLSAILVISILEPIWIYKSSIFVHEDTPFTGLNTTLNSYFSGIYKSFFIFNTMDYSGAIQQDMNGPLLYIFNIIFALMIIFNGTFGTIFVTSFYLIIGDISMFFFLYYLFENYGYNLRITASFFGFLIFFAIAGSYSSESAFLPLSLFLMFILLKGKNNNIHTKRFFFYAGVSSLVFGLLFATGGPNFLIQNFMFLVLITIFLSILSKNNPKNIIVILSISIILALLMNLGMIIGAYLLSTGKVVYTGFYAFESVALKYAFGTSNVLYALQILPFLSSNLLVVVKLIIFIISFLGVLYVFENFNTDKYIRWFVVAIFATFLVITFLYNTIFTPFGYIFKFFLAHVPFLYAIRYGNGSFSYIMGTVIAILFSVGLVCCYEYLKNKIIIRSVFMILALVILIIYVYYYAIAPYANISYFYVTIPKHVYSVSNYINNESGYFNVAALPSAAGFQYLENWYTGTDIYSYLIKKPVFTGGYVAQTEIFYPNSKYFYDEITGIIDGGIVTNNKYISRLFGVLGIKYIIVQGNAVNSSPYDPNYSDAFSFNNIYSNLNASGNITFVKRYANTTIYQNLESVRLVYGSDILNLGGALSSTLISKIVNGSFSIENTSVYSTNIPGFYTDNNTINATPISDFAQPNVSFVENTPTKVTVHIKNATTPYYLVFRETYDPHWAAFFSNGTEVNPRDHIAVNGFANAWYMNKTGNYTVTLYYTLQTDAWLTWAVSFAALFATIGIGVYGWRRDHVRGVKQAP